MGKKDTCVICKILTPVQDGVCNYCASIHTFHTAEEIRKHIYDIEVPEDYVSRFFCQAFDSLDNYYNKNLDARLKDGFQIINLAEAG